MEAGYWLSFLFSISPRGASQTINALIENNLPVIVQSTILPIVLIILFFHLTPKRASTGGLKWGMISGTVYILVIFWLNNMGNWVAAAMVKGIDYLTLYPANLFSFGLTVVGLLLLALLHRILCQENNRTNMTSPQINLRTVGFIITAFGLYFDIVYVMFLSLGAVGGWGMWYAWFTGHNLDLWLMALPFAGLPFLFQKQTSKSRPNKLQSSHSSNPEKRRLKESNLLITSPH